MRERSSTVIDVRERLWPVFRRYIFDAVVLGGAALGIIEMAVGRGSDEAAPDGPLWVLVAAVLCTTLPLLGRRRLPFLAPAAVVTSAAVFSFVEGRIAPYSAVTFFAALAAVFLFGQLQERSQAIAGLAFALAMAFVVQRNDPDGTGGDVAAVSVIFAAVWVASFALSRKLAQAAEAEQRAARLESEREAEARAAVAEERARIARELHDVVGHSVSVMTVQAGAVRRLLRPEQEKEREALLVVEQTGREALAEMRRMVGVLRRPEEAPALAPQPSLEHLERLVDQVREAGLPVRLRIEGERAALPVGVDLTAYRLVQEGLTNALKHAQAESAEVVVRYGDGEIEVTVSDDGRSSSASNGGGQGLVGMRERVAVYGGELQAGPRPEGGFRLRARLPVSAG